MTSIRLRQLGRTGVLAALLGFAAAAHADLASLFTNVTHATTTAIPRRSSIIFIQCNGLGYGDLSCYGQTKFQTPNLDRLAAEGIRFTSYYAGDAASSPSRAVLLSGRDSGRLRQRADVDIALAPDENNVVRLLKNSGYHTGLIGEWSLGDEPWTQGFDEFAGFVNSDEGQNYYADYLWRYAPKAIVDTTNNRFNDFIGKEELYPNTGDKMVQYLPDVFTTAALNFVKNNQPDQFNHHRPFFLLLDYPTPRPDTLGTNRFPVPTDAPFSDEQWPQPAKNRAAMIARLDGDIGKLLDQLKTIGMTNNVAIFFSSDTGPQNAAGAESKFFQSTGGLRGGRGELYEGGLRVPLIVRWPGNIPAGGLDDLPVGAWDIAPTLLDIAFARPAPNFDGTSLLPVLAGSPQLQPHEVFFRWELRGNDIAQAARYGDWKIVRSKTDAAWELYHLKTDPNETENVADKNPDIVKLIEAASKNFDATGRRAVWPAQISTNGNSNL
jgi:arylsulfatase A-like enzyme